MVVDPILANVLRPHQREVSELTDNPLVRDHTHFSGREVHVGLRDRSAYPWQPWVHNGRRDGSG